MNIFPTAQASKEVLSDIDDDQQNLINSYCPFFSAILEMYWILDAGASLRKREEVQQKMNQPHVWVRELMVSWFGAL